MKLTVELFAGLRERAGRAELELDDLPDELDLAGLKRELERRHPELGDLAHVAGVVGSEYAPDSTPLRAGEPVALLPPVSGGAPDEAAELARGLFELDAAALDPEACRLRVEHDSCGAVVVFCGNARQQSRGRDVTRLEYEAFERMAGPEMARIFAACTRAHGDPDGDHPERALRMLCRHRLGPVAVGQPAVVVAVASPHRAAAFDAARFLIDELKKSLPVWKKEVYADGEHWIGSGS